MCARALAQQPGAGTPRTQVHMRTSRCGTQPGALGCEIHARDGGTHSSGRSPLTPGVHVAHELFGGRRPWDLPEC